MFGKTEISYMMRDKVIPSLLNSETKIKYEDIKYILEKSSYWRNKYHENALNHKNKKLLTNDNNSNKNFNTEGTKNTVLSTDRESFSRISLFTDIFKIKNNQNKSRNYKINNLYNNKNIQNDKEVQIFSPQKKKINFCNPLLKPFSNKIYKLTETSFNKTPSFRKQKSGNKNIAIKKRNLSAKHKNKYLSINYKKGLKNLNTEYEYKNFIFFKNNKIEKSKLENQIIKKDEENNHLILRGLSMNDEQKYIFLRCQLINIDMEGYKKNKNNSKTSINRKNIKKNHNHIIKKRNNSNYKINYSLKRLLNLKGAINI